MIALEQVINHARNRDYLSQIQRDEIRIKATGEVFTPPKLVRSILKQIQNIKKQLFKNPTLTVIDPACGDGNFLSEVLIAKMENGLTYEQSLGQTFGIDLMADNIYLARERLLCKQTDENLKNIVHKNFVVADALTYHMRFDGTGPYTSIQDLHNKGLFEEWHW